MNDSLGAGRASGGGVPAAHADWLELHDEYRQRLFAFALKLAFGDRHLAEDLTQETMLRAWRHREKLVERRSSFLSWLFTVARNINTDWLRARRGHPVEISDQRLAEIPDGGDDFRAVLTRSLLQDALATLTADHRSVLVEMFLRDSTASEAATALGIPEGTVKSRCHYALRSLNLAMAP
jgi:RNA polymerase sigma-70 factor (ECF subfamily)